MKNLSIITCLKIATASAKPRNDVVTYYQTQKRYYILSNTKASAKPRNDVGAYSPHEISSHAQKWNEKTDNR